jgi:hypothetical protein
MVNAWPGATVVALTESRSCRLSFVSSVATAFASRVVVLEVETLLEEVALLEEELAFED